MNNNGYSTTDVKVMIKNVLDTSESDSLVDDLVFLIMDLSQHVHQVDLYNIFYRFLKKYENDEYKKDEYEAIGIIMDYIWSGSTDNIQIYEEPLTDRDITARKTTKRMFPKK